MSSELFVNWAYKEHKKSLISEIEDSNQNEVLTQLSQEESSVELVHDLDKFDQEYKEKRTYVRDMPHGSVDSNVDPEVQVPQKISPTSSNNLKVVFY